MEMEDEDDEDDDNVREDLSDSSEDYAKTQKIDTSDGKMVSNAEMQEIIDSQKRQIAHLTEQAKKHEEEKDQIIESFK